jgi:transcriptional regulator with XRE-family HTH domain
MAANQCCEQTLLQAGYCPGIQKTSEIDQRFKAIEVSNSGQAPFSNQEDCMSKTVSYAQWALEPYCIGQKLRMLRLRKRLTLARLAAETGLSTALLSKLETNRMIPTLPTLATISRVYGVGMNYFFAEPARHSLSITRKAHLQSSGRGLESIKITPLNPIAGCVSKPNSTTETDPAAPKDLDTVTPVARTSRLRLVAQMMEFPPGVAASILEGLRETSGLLYVLEGQLQLDAGGMREHLDAGDCACIESEMPLAWSAAGSRRCRVLAVFPSVAWPES